MNYWLFLIPILTAFTGWFTVQALAWLLFHPTTPKRIAGIRMHGFFFRQQNRLAAQLGTSLQQSFPVEWLQDKISNPANLQQVMPLIEGQLDEFFRVRLVKDLPYVAPFLGEKTIQSLKELFIRELTALFPEMMRQFAGGFYRQFDPTAAIQQRFSTPETAREIGRRLRPQFHKAAWIGFFIGLLVGALQFALAVLTS